MLLIFLLSSSVSKLNIFTNVFLKFIRINIMLLFLVFNCKYWRPQNIVILCFLSSNSIPLKLCTLYRVLYTLKLCQYSHSKGSGLDLFFQTVLLWAQDAFCLATSVIWTKIFHKETTSKMFPFFYSKLHGNGIHLNLLVASNRNQLELAGTNPKSLILNFYPVWCCI